MTTITIDRAVVEQALETLEAMQSYAAAERKGLRICDEAIPALRAALAQQAEQEQAGCDTEADCTSQPWCRISGECHRKQPKQKQGQAEPVEPVAWMQPRTLDGYLRPDLGYETCSKSDYGAFPVYTAPPQRKPLTDEKIWRTYKNLWMFHPAEEPRLAGDVLKFARAIERAHGIKEN